MTFRVGQKVVCVDATERDGHLHSLKKGCVYTIASFGKSKDGSPGIRLAEIDRPLPYYVWRFRPVVERKTDISIFTQMLNPQKVTA